MFKVGITGNIGSGKTTLSRMFAVLGIPVFYADLAAKMVMTTDLQLTDDIRAAFGQAAYFPDGTLNRKYLAGKVFGSSGGLDVLNSLVHPAVFRAFDLWLEQAGPAPYIMKEAAVLFESGSYRLCDRSILVMAPLDLRIDRVIRRDGLSKQEILDREARQMPEEEKRKLADFAIINDDTRMVIPQVLELHEQLLTLAGMER